MLLQQVASAGEAVSNGDLVALTGLPKATVSRITTQLVGAGHRLTLLREEELNLETAFMALTKGITS